MHSMQSVQRGVSTCCGSFGEVDSEKKTWEFYLAFLPFFWDGEFTWPEFNGESWPTQRLGIKLGHESLGWNACQMDFMEESE